MLELAMRIYVNGIFNLKYLTIFIELNFHNSGNDKLIIENTQ